MTEAQHQASDPATWVARYGQSLFAYALSRVFRHDLAEDLVQDTLLAAFRDRGRFKGRSTELTWLIGILKHKIYDSFRRRERQAPEVTAVSIDGMDAAFNDAGHWMQTLEPWPRAPRDVTSLEFAEVFQQCMALLPEGQAAAFELREIEGLSNEEICKIMKISATNLWVRLHRARLRLRKCLDAQWFGRSAQGGQ